MDLIKLIPLAGLLEKRVDDLTLSDVASVATAMGVTVNVTEELLGAGLALLKGSDIHTVADMVRSPESISQLVGLMDRRSREDKIAAAEVDGMYAVAEPSPIDDEENFSPSPALLGSSQVGWRLPGESHRSKA